jgi:hypothetical protein
VTVVQRVVMVVRAMGLIKALVEEVVEVLADMPV